MPRMKNSNDRSHDAWGFVIGWVLLVFVSTSAVAHVRLSSDWGPGFLPSGHLVPDDQDEGKQLEKAAVAAVKTRTARPQDAQYAPDLPFKLFVDQVKFYIQPLKFMGQSRPGEVCTSAGKAMEYRCKEGQRQTQTCYLSLFDANFHEVGLQSIHIDEPAPVFCNAVPGIGVFNAERDELLVTVQYFFIDGTHATKVSDLGTGWKRMTVLLRLKTEDGRVRLEQDDRCLGNPNGVETIPDARRQLKRCQQGRSR